MVVWLIGLSGSGKSTIGRALADRLRAGGRPVVYLDGDVLRDVWGDRLGHDVEGRRRDAHRISHLCRLLDGDGIWVVAAVLSIFPEWQAWNRHNFSRYFEVFLDVPMTVLEGRDPKAIYARARRGELPNVVGVDIPFPRPANPDLVLDNREELTDISPVVGRIVETLEEIEPAR